jgi:hypothetical protein
MRHGSARISSEADTAEAVAILEQALDAARACADDERCIGAGGQLIMALATQAPT